jgi:cellulose synthase (UDP-forming)
VHASITNSRIQGGHRHSFWAEVYETVLAWYIVRPTTVALLNPHKGKFNVTAKGGLVDKSYFDWHISLPYMVIVGLNLIGFSVGVGRILWGPGDEIATTLLNMFWTVYNLLILGAAISVASETKQIRHTQRVALKIPAILHLGGGELVHCHTDDFSEGGVALAMDAAPVLKIEDTVSVSLWRGAEEYVFPARVVGTSATRVRVRWELTTAQQNQALVHCTFVRADAWVSWSEGRLRDRPLSGLRRVLATGMQGYRRVAKQSWPNGHLLLDKVVNGGHYLSTLLPRQPKVGPQ